jgi:hypothetical protein
MRAPKSTPQDENPTTIFSENQKMWSSGATPFFERLWLAMTIRGGL